MRISLPHMQWLLFSGVTSLSTLTDAALLSPFSPLQAAAEPHATTAANWRPLAPTLLTWDPLPAALAARAHCWLSAGSSRPPCSALSGAWMTTS